MKPLGVDGGTDNSHFQQKAELRATALAASGWGQFHVLDLCAASGKLWRHLSKGHRVASYLACDRKPRSVEVIRGEAADLVQTINLAPFNVIDVDTYGEPWEVLVNLLPRLRRQTLVFLTHGHLAISVTPSLASRAVCGLPTDWKIPMSRDLVTYLGEQALAHVWRHAEVVAAWRLSKPRVSYYALNLIPYLVDSKEVDLIQSAKDRPALARRPARSTSA